MDQEKAAGAVATKVEATTAEATRATKVEATTAEVMMAEATTGEATVQSVEIAVRVLVVEVKFAAAAVRAAAEYRREERVTGSSRSHRLSVTLPHNAAAPLFSYVSPAVRTAMARPILAVLLMMVQIVQVEMKEVV